MSCCGDSEIKEANKIKIFRILTSTILLAVVAVGAVGSYVILTTIETDTMERQFASYSDQLRDDLLKSVDRNVYASNSLSKVYGNYCLEDDDWPHCLLNFDYMESIASELLKSADIPGFGFSILVSSEEQKKFELDMYRVLKQYNVLNSSFGWGVYGLSPTAGSPDLRFKIVNGSFGLQMLAPLVQLSNFEVSSPSVMYDEYSEYSRFLALNQMRNCTQWKKSKSQPCNILSDIITFPASLSQPVSEIPPKSLLFTSVQPRLSNSSEARGAIITAVEWASALSNIIPDDIAGIECVVGINFREFIFEIKKSNAIYSDYVVRKHKLDSSACKRHSNCVSLNVFDGDSTYFMWVRKTREFDAQYETAGPVIASVIFTVMILLLSVIFFAYDMFVNKEILQKEIILRTKQLFVRYISHEIRTPINTIHIGLSLLMGEVNDLLGKQKKLSQRQSVVAAASASTKGREQSDDDEGNVVEEKLTHWKDMLVDIEMSSASAIQVLNDLLDYEQIQISRLNMDMSVVSMWTVCESVFWSFRFNLEAKRIKYLLTMELETDLSLSTSSRVCVAADHQEYLKHMVVFGDSKKLEQVMRNLISNAIKFTHPEGTITVDVAFVPGSIQNTSDELISASGNGAMKVLPVRARQGTMKVSVRDSGEGLTQEQQQTLFTAEGVQFNPNRLQDGKGSGLGLWISKGIIKEHKGFIEVSSPGLGQGTTFVVQIPCRYDESFRYIPFEKPKDCSSSPDMSVCLKREIDVRRILLVDDSVPNVKVCRRLLTNAGYEVDVAYNGEECLSKLNTEVYHLIIIDNHMPVMDGPTAVKIMRSREYKLPVVGLTGSITPDELRDFKLAGCDDVLCKPLSIQKLSDVLAHVQSRHTEEYLSPQNSLGGVVVEDDKSSSLV